LKEKGKKILICDDNVDFLRVLADMLKFHGYEPIMAKTGSQALEKFAETSPDLVILDYKLPDMDGTAVLQELRASDNTLPVVVMTGYGHEKLAAEVIKLGAMDYLVKPMKSGELLGSIEHSLRRVEQIKKQQELEKLVFWGKLFPLVAHEIRTPLHSIGGALTLIRNRHQNDKTTARALQIIHEEIVRLNEFVNQCLDFSRSSSKEGFSSIDLNEAVRSCVQLMTPFLKNTARKLTVETRLDDSLPVVHVNPYEIKQVLINLVRNAVEAIPREGRIVVETHYNKGEPGTFVEIRVIDNGMGVKGEDLANVFTPFFSRKRKGIGLGLAICKKIVEENHHGQIRIDSRPSRGTTMTVMLPIGARKDTVSEAS
jgi:signal transduction histidine kinase